MSELGYHVRMSPRDGRVIASTTAAQRCLAQAVLSVGMGCTLLAFRAADTHLHLVVGCSRRHAGLLARSLGKSLHDRLPLACGFGQTHFEAIRDQRHLGHAFDYVLRQDVRHGIALDPRAEASNLPDLLGLRLVGRYTAANVARLLPRVAAGQLAARLGLTLDQLREGELGALGQALGALADAAAATLALPDLRGRAVAAVRARRAAVHLLGDEVSVARLAPALLTTARTVQRLKEQPADPLLVEAVARQLRLRAVWSEQRAEPIGLAAAG